MIKNSLSDDRQVRSCHSMIWAISADIPQTEFTRTIPHTPNVTHHHVLELQQHDHDRALLS